MTAGPQHVPAGSSKAKVRPIAKSVDPEDTGLPSNLDAERFVLGSVLLDDSRYGEITTLNPDDFALERHRSIFHCMQALHDRGEHIDRTTVAEELGRRGELGPDGFTYLVSLDDGLPRISHLDSYVRIVREKSTLRRTILAAQKVQNECLLHMTSPTDILANHIA